MFTKSSVKRRKEAGGIRRLANVPGFVNDTKTITGRGPIAEGSLVPNSFIMGGLTPCTSRVTNRDLQTITVAVSDNLATNVLIDPRDSSREGNGGFLQFQGVVHSTFDQQSRNLRDAKVSVAVLSVVL